MLLRLAYLGDGQRPGDVAAAADERACQGHRNPRLRTRSWLQLLALDGDLAKAEPRRLRYRLLHTAARVTRGQRRRWLRIPATWPWANQLTAATDGPQPHPPTENIDPRRYKAVDQASLSDSRMIKVSRRWYRWAG